MQDIKCCVIVNTGCGPDLFFVKVRCDESQYESGQHYETAKQWAEQHGAPDVVIDDMDPGREVMSLAEWEDMSTIDIHGNTIEQTIEEGFMRVFDNDGKHLGDTPVLNWKCTDGSYGLLERLESLGTLSAPDVTHYIEREAMELFSKHPDAMLKCLGYSAIYIPKN